MQPIECNAGRASPGAEFTAIARDAAFWIRHAEAVLVDPAELRDLLRDLGLQSWARRSGPAPDRTQSPAPSWSTPSRQASGSFLPAPYCG